MKIVKIYQNFCLWLKSSYPKKDTLYEFQENINHTYGFFLDKKTGVKYIFKIEDVEFFKQERFYLYQPKSLLTFGYLGSPIIRKQTWVRVAYP